MVNGGGGFKKIKTPDEYPKNKFDWCFCLWFTVTGLCVQQLFFIFLGESLTINFQISIIWCVFCVLNNRKKNFFLSKFQKKKKPSRKFKTQTSRITRIHTDNIFCFSPNNNNRCRCRRILISVCDFRFLFLRCQCLCV